MPLCRNPLSRSLMGAKRKCLFALHTSANDPKRTWGQLVFRQPAELASLRVLSKHTSFRGGSKANDQHAKCTLKFAQTSAKIGDIARKPTAQLNLKDAEQRPSCEQWRLARRDFDILDRQFNGAAEQPDQSLACPLE